MKYLRNTWYVAGWDREVVAGQILARRYLGEPVVLFRDGAGSPKALADVCPHRMAPLRRGKLVEAGLQCGYHGLTFDGGGACVHNPFGEPSKKMTVRSYPVAERHSLVWIWMGEPAQANTDLIPDLSVLDADTAHVGKDYLKVSARYELEIENILDLSHIQQLHPTTLGSAEVSAGEYECVLEGDTVWSNRYIFGEVMGDDWNAGIGLPPGAASDRWLRVRWNAPANLILYVGMVAAGEPRTPEREGVTAHLFTPETDRTTHYWFAATVPKTNDPRGERMAAASVAYLRGPFENEDAPMLEAQEANIGERDLSSVKWGWLPGDAAGVHARRILREKIEAEAALTESAGLRQATG